MPVRKFVKDYLSFSRKERFGIILILGLVTLVYFFPSWTKKKEAFPLKTLVENAVDTLEATDAEDQTGDAIYRPAVPVENNNFSSGALFSFDPNVLSSEGWKKLGLSEKVIKTIVKYRNKGGKFYKPGDLQKIWGLPRGFYKRVKDYVVIGKKRDNNKVEVEAESWKSFKKVESKIAIIKINEADTAAWIALPGIGSKLASRIVNFRERLGGFYSVDQVKETYGLADSTFQKIRSYLQTDSEVRKININTVSKDELKTHPYIRWNLANAIVEYRNQHGSFKNLTDLKNITLISEEVFSKITPYLKTE